MVGPNTHLKADPRWVGAPVRLAAGEAEARLCTSAEMGVDGEGLVHGGFVFGLADYAAMLAVNDPFVVLGAAEVRLLKPVRAGEVLVANARVEAEAGKRRVVSVRVRRGEDEVMTGTFTCFVLPRHVLDPEAP